jgi:hypothetical protein
MKAYFFPIFSSMKNTLFRRAAAGVGVSLTMAIGSYGLLASIPVGASGDCDVIADDMTGSLNEIDTIMGYIDTIDETSIDIAFEGTDNALEIHPDLLSAALSADPNTSAWDDAWDDLTTNYSRFYGEFSSISWDVYSLESYIDDIYVSMGGLEGLSEDFDDCTL